MTDPSRPPADRGQATVLIALILAATLVVAVLMTAAARHVITRQRAAVAADALALASVQQLDLASEVAAEWSGLSSSAIVPGQAQVVVEETQARSFAKIVVEPVEAAPAIVAITARAEQLLGRNVDPVKIVGIQAYFTVEMHKLFAQVAPELGMCRASATADLIVYELC